VLEGKNDKDIFNISHRNLYRCVFGSINTKNQHYQRYEILPQKHALRALEMVDEVLSESGMTGVEIDVLAYGEGPGAFTGVRIASGVVQGLALGWDKPVIGVSSLEAMAERVLSELTSLETYANLDEISWCALMDARMKEVYFQSGTFNLKQSSGRFLRRV